jgi:GMC oxidoreductase
VKPKLVIIGSGLGGCFLADGLADSYDVHFVEMVSKSPYFLQKHVKDTHTQAVTYPHIGNGLGGTTAFWHNGLIEITEEIFKEKWPFLKSELDPYYHQAYKKLAGVERQTVALEFAALRRRYLGADMPADNLGLGLFYPRKRINAWKELALQGRVKVTDGEVIDIASDGESKIEYLLVKSENKEIKVSGDFFVLAAGGLGTPLLLNKLAEKLDIPALQQAGMHYEDHPLAVVGELVFDEPLYQLWNYPAKCTKGSLRLPFVVKQAGLLVSFQLRPSTHFWIINPRNRVKSVLNELRNKPFDVRNYFKLMTRWDDILEILSFKFGIRLPTKHYSLLMMAEQTPSSTRAVWHNIGESTIYRQWIMSEDYIATLQDAIGQILASLGDKIKLAKIFPDWPQHIMSSSHHSGTARMASSNDQGVCDENGQVRGLQNLFVCDGSAIPGTGYANTGLTIAALGIRMANYLSQVIAKNKCH